MGHTLDSWGPFVLTPNVGAMHFNLPRLDARLNLMMRTPDFISTVIASGRDLNKPTYMSVSADDKHRVDLFWGR